MNQKAKASHKRQSLKEGYLICNFDWFTEVDFYLRKKDSVFYFNGISS
jgi:hypothetical protein